MTARYVLRRLDRVTGKFCFYVDDGTMWGTLMEAHRFADREHAGNYARRIGATVVKLVRKPRVVRVTREQLKAAAKAWSKSLDAAVVWRRLPKATRATLCSAMRVCFTAAGFEVES